MGLGNAAHQWQHHKGAYGKVLHLAGVAVLAQQPRQRPDADLQQRSVAQHQKQGIHGPFGIPAFGVNIKVELSPEAQGNGDQQDHGGQGAQEPLFGITEPLGPQLALGIEQAQIDHHPGGVEKQNIHDRHDPNGRGKDLIFL